MFQGPKVKYTCSMETVQQNGRFTLFSSKLPSNIYSILFAYSTLLSQNKKRDISENVGGTLCMSGTIYFSQKYTVLLKIKW